MRSGYTAIYPRTSAMQYILEDLVVLPVLSAIPPQSDSQRTGITDPPIPY